MRWLLTYAFKRSVASRIMSWLLQRLACLVIERENVLRRGALRRPSWREPTRIRPRSRTWRCRRHWRPRVAE